MLSVVMQQWLCNMCAPTLRVRQERARAGNLCQLPRKYVVAFLADQNEIHVGVFNVGKFCIIES